MLRVAKWNIGVHVDFMPALVFAPADRSEEESAMAEEYQS